MDYMNISSLPPQGIRITSPTVEVIPGAGECDYFAFIGALKDVGYKGYLTVESHKSDITPEIQATQAYYYMKRLLTKAQ